MSRPRITVAAATASFGGGLGALAVLQHRAYWTGRFDVGNLVQAVWTTSRGDPLSMTGLRGDQLNRLGAHFDPIVAVFAPLWWVWPDASLLLVGQAVGISLGAVPVYLLAERHLESAWAGTGFALAYLSYPATQWLALDDFHPVAFAAPLLLWGFWFLDTDRVVPFVAVAALACLTKEQVGLTVAAMGVWYAVRSGRRRPGLVIAGAGTTVAIVAVTIVVPFFAIGDGSPFESRYAAVGGSPGGIVRTVATDPLTVASAVTESRDAAYLADLVLPLLLLPLLAPMAALTALPELALNLLSDTRTQTSIHFHYTAAAIPGLVVGSVLGTARLRRLAPRLAVLVPRGVLVTTLLAGVLLGPLPVWRHVPFGSTLGTRDHVVTAHARAAARAVSLVPPAAAVSATNTVGAHLSERNRIFSFPVLRDATWVVLDTKRPSYLDQADEPARFAGALSRFRTSERFVQIAELDGVLVFRRR